MVNGGNCLGIRSLPGRYDTLFIPGHKLDLSSGRPVPLALLSQSGAFAVARLSKLAGLDPRFVVTFGNQIDLTLGDYLSYLAGDAEVRVFACYLEGFRPLDGRRFLEAVRHRCVRGARGPSLVAAIEMTVERLRVTRDLTTRAGGLIAETIAEFEDLVRIFCLLADRRPSGRRLGAMSNAGFESVAVADNLDGLELADLGRETAVRISATLRKSINPLDVTPVLGDEDFAETARHLLSDPAVDVGLIGCVPLTGALQTLPAGGGHQENLADSSAVVERLIGLWRTTTVPWVAVVDSGPLYDALAARLDRAGVPTFRSADRALRALVRWTLTCARANHCRRRRCAPPARTRKTIFSVPASAVVCVSHPARPTRSFAPRWTRRVAGWR